MTLYIRKYPITSFIFAINLLMLIIVILTGGFTIENLHRYGSSDQISIENGEYYRLITSPFLHGSLIHFVMNMAGLLAFGKFLESWLGKFKFLGLYMVSAISSSIVSYLLVNGPSVGASGAIYGCLGFVLYISLFKKTLLDDSTNKKVIQLSLVNLLFSFIIPDINIVAHISGLVTGLLLGPLMMQLKLERSKRRKVRKVSRKVVRIY